MQTEITNVETFTSRFPMDRITDLGAFRDSATFDEVVQAARDSFSSELEAAEQSLSDPDTAVAVLRFPPDLGGSPQRDALLAATLAVAIGGALTHASIEPKNGTPFGIANTSPAGRDEIAAAGMVAIGPNDVHGFHNDVRVASSTEEVFLPARIALHNIYIGFRDPGHLLWVPYRRWQEFEAFKKEFDGKPYVTELRPQIYQGDDLHGVADRRFTAPVFSTSPDGEDLVCVAGHISNPADTDDELPARLAASLADHAEPIVIPQSTRQVVVFANSSGFHGRDAFNDAIDGRRVLLRMVDKRGHRVARGFLQLQPS